MLKPKKVISDAQKILLSIALKGNKNGKGNTGKHHSLETKEKMRLHMIGDKNPHWKGGITKQNQAARNSLEYSEWRKKVFERDKYTCQECAQIGGQLEVDHLKQFAYYPELRYEVSNGKTLCHSCHCKTPTYRNHNKIT